MPDHATRQRRRWYQLLHYQLLHTAHRMLAAFPAAAYPVAYPAYPHICTTLLQCNRARYRACRTCTTFLKTESCHFQIQLSRNFQNLHSNAVLVCEYINIWSFKEVIRVLVDEIFYERLVRV